MGSELFDSIVSKVAVHLPMFAKVVLEAGVERYGANPWTATPSQIKKALDEYVIPKLRIFQSIHSDAEVMGGGLVRTDREDRVSEISPGIGQYMEMGGKLEPETPALFEKLHEKGLVMKVEELERCGRSHLSRKVKIRSPHMSVLDVTLFLISDAHGRPAGTVSSMHDITLYEALIDETASLYEKLQDSNVKLKEQYEKLLELDRMKSAFVDTTAHELKTPITSLKAYIEMLQEGKIKTFKDRETRAHEIINRNILHLIKIISSTLDLSRLDSGKMTFEFQPQSIHDISATVVENLKPLFSRRSQKCRMEVPPDLPPVFADRDRVEQVLTNLLTNAIAASCDDSVIEVKARLIENEGLVEVEVKDYGIGIHPDEQEKVFMRFYSPDSIHHFTGETDFRGQGAGLGLSIAREYVDRMGGRIWIRSKGIEGEGTSVLFTLPTWKE